MLEGRKCGQKGWTIHYCSILIMRGETQPEMRT